MEGTGENMFCSNCGCELQDGWSVCPNCGMRIEEEGRTSQMNVGTNQYDPNSVQMQGQPSRPQPPQKPSSGGLSGWQKWLLIVVGIAVLTVIVGFVVYKVESKLSDNRRDADKTVETTEATEQEDTQVSTGQDTEVTTESVVSEESDDTKAPYSADMVVDSNISTQVQYEGYTAVYHLPHINYEGDACGNVNEQIEKLGKNYMNEDGNVCIGIGYKWAVYGDILSLLVSVDFDWDATEYTIYNINLKKDVMLSEDDLLGAVNLDISAYESAVRNALDQYFWSLYGEDNKSDEALNETYNQTIADSNIKDAVPYINKDGVLCVSAKIYSIAGANYYYHMVEVQELEDSCTFSGESAEYDSNANVDYSANEIQTSDDYILPNSDSEYISDSDLDGLTADECRLALNEIYARHGRKFNDPDYRSYFNSKSWYNGTIDPDDFDDTALFNKYEIANRDYIIDYEKRMGYK